jgi:hypothetical protein
MTESTRRDPGDAFPWAPLLTALMSRFVPFPWGAAGAGGGELPSPFAARRSSPRDGRSYPSAPPGYSEALGAGAEYSAFRIGTQLFIRARGTLGNWNQIADIRQSPLKIYPPLFDFLVYSPQTSSPAVRPFDFTVVVGYPLDPTSVTVRDARGSHRVQIAAAPADLRAMAPDSAPSGGFGVGETIEEAVDAAIATLPADRDAGPDAMSVYRVVETGKMIGGFAGVNWFYARVASSHPPA